MSSGGFCLDDDTSVGIFGDPSPGLLVRLSARGLIGLSRVAWLSSGMSSADANAQHPDRHQHHYGQEVVAWRCTILLGFVQEFFDAILLDPESIC